MRKEVDWQKTAQIMLAATMVVEAGRYLNLPQTQRAFDALTSPDPTCAEIMPTLSDHYDIIAVFSGGSFKDEEGVTRPNSYQRDRLKEAAAAFVAGYSDRILLLNGDGDELATSSIDLLQTYVTEISNGKIHLDRNSVTSVTHSINSADNASDLADHMIANHISSALGITDLFHTNRVNVLIANHGANVDIAPTECLAEEYNPQDLDHLENRNGTEQMDAMRVKERIGEFELLVDFEGKLSIVYKTIKFGISGVEN